MEEEDNDWERREDQCEGTREARVRRKRLGRGRELFFAGEEGGEQNRCKKREEKNNQDVSVRGVR